MDNYAVVFVGGRSGRTSALLSGPVWRLAAPGPGALRQFKGLEETNPYFNSI